MENAKTKFLVSATAKLFKSFSNLAVHSSVIKQLSAGLPLFAIEF